MSGGGGLAAMMRARELAPSVEVMLRFGYGALTKDEIWDRLVMDLGIVPQERMDVVRALHMLMCEGLVIRVEPERFWEPETYRLNDGA